VGAQADLDRSASLLLASAAEMRVAAETPGCASAIAASLGPMEAALENLARTLEAMEVVARERLSEGDGAPWRTMDTRRRGSDRA
jgi:hypothetical protein